MKAFAFAAVIIIAGIIGIWAFAFQEDGYTLVWSDEFNTASFPDADKWNVITGNGCPERCGFGNNELQYYTNHKDNVRIENGNLIIEARQDTIGTNYYTSAKLTSKFKGDWQYGKITVRAKLPKGVGTWPAIWMLPSLKRKMDWPSDGEIDIMEHVGYHEGWILGTIHTEKYNHLLGTQKSDSIYVADATDAFHDYTLEWDKDRLKWFVDGKLFETISRNREAKPGWPFDEPFHLILNLAIGGNLGGKHGVSSDAFPATFMIDYVRIYQLL